MSLAVDYHSQVNDLRQYLLPVMIELYGDKCATCKQQFNSYDIDHKRYATDITVYDLQLLCTDCHRDKTLISGDMYQSQTAHCSTCTCY
jgi:hypothetical protein